MTNASLVASSAVLAIGLAAGGIALRPAPAPAFDAAREGAALLAPHEERIAKLEADLEKARRAQASAERQAAEALSAALEGRRELERLRDRTDDLFAVLESAGSRARASGGGGPGAGAGMGANASGEPLGATGTAVASTTGALASGPGREPTPGDVEVVKRAMEQVRQEENDRRRVQQTERRKQFLNQRISELAQKIGLTPQQSEQVAAIYEGSMAKRQEIFQGMREGGGDPGQIREQMEALRLEDERKLQETLSPQQYTELQAIQEEERQTRGGGPGGGMFGGPPGGGFGGPPQGGTQGGQQGAPR